MKHLRLLLSVALFIVYTINSISAQSLPADENDNKFTAEQQEVVDRVNQWQQEILVGNKVDKVKSYFPKNGKIYFFGDNTVGAYSYDELISKISKKGVNTVDKVEMLGIPTVKVSDDGKTAWVIFISKFSYRNNETNKVKSYSYKFYDVMNKENGIWVFHTGHNSSYNEKVEVKIDIEIIKDYVGTYECDINDRKEEFRLEENYLISTENNKEYKMIPVSESSFNYENSDTVITFVRNSKGEVTGYDQTYKSLFWAYKKTN